MNDDEWSFGEELVFVLVFTQGFVYQCPSLVKRTKHSATQYAYNRITDALSSIDTLTTRFSQSHYDHTGATVAANGCMRCVERKPLQHMCLYCVVTSSYSRFLEPSPTPQPQANGHVVSP